MDTQQNVRHGSAFPVKRLSSAIGAEVLGSDLRGAGEQGLEQLRQLVSDRQVVFIRDFGTDERPFVALSKAFGSLSVHPLHSFLGREQTVAVIADTPDRPPAGFPLHTDLSWVDAPPRFGFLQAMEIPGAGGDTIWVSQQAVLASLSPRMGSFLHRLTGEHRIDKSLRRTVADNHGEEVAEQFESAYPPTRHPLVVKHPDTGEPSLYLCPMYLDSIPELEPSESSLLLGLLNDRLTDPNFAVRWTWSEGDVAIWDEASTVHMALVDHNPEPRRMRRYTTDGERLVPSKRSRS